jgi:hypothetical protein
LLSLAAVLGASAAVAASAKSTRPPAKSGPLVLSPRFARVGGQFLTSDRQQVLLQGGRFGASSGRLIASDGRQRTLTFPPGCGGDTIGGPWIALLCRPFSSPTIGLYNIPKRSFRPLTMSPGSDGPGCGSSCVTPSGIGANWIGLTFNGCQAHCFPVPTFQNLHTGEVRADPSNATTTVNLNSPALSEKVCRPVKVPFEPHFTNPPSSWGSVTFEGRFAIAAGASGAFLEKCGSRLHERLTTSTSPGSNAHAIVWESAPARLRGVFLPSLRRFTIKLPARVDPLAAHVRGLFDDTFGLVLTPRTLYLETAGGLWASPAPKLPAALPRP